MYMSYEKNNYSCLMSIADEDVFLSNLRIISVACQCVTAATSALIYLPVLPLHSATLRLAHKIAFLLSPYHSTPDHQMPSDFPSGLNHLLTCFLFPSHPSIQHLLQSFPPAFC